MKKLILIPTLLTIASTPLISLVGCDKSKEDPYVIKVNLNKGRNFHLESKPFSLEKDITYTMNFDLTQGIEHGAQIGARSILFSNQYLPNNITFFQYQLVTYERADSIEDIGQDINKYYVGQKGTMTGIFFFAVDGYNNDKFQVKFLSDTEQENITVELNGS